MKLQQLRYVIKVAETGSISHAAQRLFLAQPSLSKAISDLESEMGVRIFNRSRTGVTLTEEGTRFLAYARQVVEQADLLEQQYKGGEALKRAFAVSAQHYSFVVSAFVALVKEYDKSRYEFALRESTTAGIIDDVRTQRSELGVIYRSSFNREVLGNVVHGAGLAFEPLFEATPHVFVSATSPLARKDRVSMADLAPYPRLTYDQGIENSFYFAEELHITEEVDRSIVVTDRATLFNLVIGLNGYTICSGILSRDLNGDQIVAVPLDSPERMELGYLYRPERPLTPLAQRYLELMKADVAPWRDESATR